MLRGPASKLLIVMFLLCFISLLQAQDVDTLLNEEFEGAVFPPAGWDTLAGGGLPALDIDDWYLDDADYIFNTGDGVHVPDGNCAGVEYHFSTPAHNDWLMTPAMDIAAYDSIYLWYYHSFRTFSTGESLAYVVIDIDPPNITPGDTLDWDDTLWYYDVQFPASNPWYAETLKFDLTPYIAGGDSFRIGWVYKRYNDYWWGVDNVLIIAWLAPGDDNPPFITHTPLGGQDPATPNYPVQADIVDDVDLDEPTCMLHYSTGGGWTNVVMNNIGGDTFERLIPQQPVWTIVQYYISACDTAGNCAQTDTFSFPIIGEYFAYDDVDPFPESPTYAWFDISGIGTAMGLADDGRAGLALPFTFRFYGTDYESLWVCSNGWLSLGSDPGTNDYGNDPMPAGTIPTTIIAPFWDDFDPAEPGAEVYYYYDVANNRYIVQFDAVPHWHSPTPTDPETFQCILLDPLFYTSLGNNGEILCHYNTVNDPSGCSIGLEDESQVYGYQYLYNGTYHPDAVALAGGNSIKFTTDPPPAGAIGGNATLTGRVDHTGIQVNIGDTGIFGVTDAAGDFLCPFVPPGVYDVWATFPGFYNDTVFGVVAVIDETTMVVLVLDPRPVGWVAGYGDLTDTGPLGDPGIDVTILGTAFNTLTAGDGYYCFDAVDAGTYTVEGAMADYFSDFKTITVTAAETTWVDTLFLTPNPPMLDEDFDVGDGGLVANPPFNGWEWGNPTYYWGPPGAHSAPNCWGTAINDDYASSADWYLDCHFAATPVTFSFWHWYDIETGFDGGQVYYSTDDGSSWILWTPPGGYPVIIYTGWGNVIEGQFAYSGYIPWTQVTMDFTGLGPVVTDVRFRFASDASFGYAGWYVDDFLAYEWKGGDVEGHVYDITTLEPIQGAYVKCDGVHALSDEDGYYHVTDALVGFQDLSAHKTEYFPVFTNIGVLLDETVYMDLYMYPVLVDTPIVGETTYEGEDTLFFEFCNTSNNTIDIVLGGQSNIPCVGRAIHTDKTNEIQDISSVMNRNTIDPAARTAPPSEIGPSRALARSTALGDVLASYYVPFDSPVLIAWGVGVQNCSNFWVSNPQTGGDPYGNFNFQYRKDDGSFTGTFYDANPWCGGWAADMTWDGQYIWQVSVDADGGNNDIYAWDPITGVVMETLTDPAGIWNFSSQRGIAYDARDDVFYLGGWNWTVIHKIKGMSWDVPGEILEQIPVGTYAIAGLAFHPTRRTLWFSTNAPLDQIIEMDPATGTVLTEWAAPGGTGSYSGAALSIDPEGKLYYVNQNNNTVYVIESFPTLPEGISIEPLQATLLPGECIDIAIIVDDGQPLPGLYNFDILVYMSEYVPPYAIPVHLRINPTLDQWWNLVSFPVDAAPNDFYAQLNDDIVPFYYSATRSNIYAYNPETATYYLPGGFERSKGYYLESWVGGCAFDVFGEPYTTDVLLDLTYYDAPRYPGWHLVGNAFNRKLDWDAVCLDPDFFNMDRTYWTWDRGGWAWYNPAAPGGAPRKILPYKGMFVRIIPGGPRYGLLPMKLEQTSVTFAKEVPSVVKKAPKIAAPQKGDKNALAKKTIIDEVSEFTLRLSVKAPIGSQTAWDRYNYLSTNIEATDGVDEYDILDFQMDPVPGAVTIPAYFTLDLEQYTMDTRSLFSGVTGESKTWSFSIDCHEVGMGRTVTIYWPKTQMPSGIDASFGIDNIDDAYSFYLIDEETEAAVDMRSGDTSYSFVVTTFNYDFTVEVLYSAVGIEEKPIIPVKFALHQNMPNPFNANTTIKYDIPAESHVSLKVYNILGSEIRSLVDKDCEAGFYQIMWDGKDDHGTSVGSGIYFYEVRTEKFLDKKKMIIIK
ncbi:T9SS type A sorting domain-containing protein [bacterium]|nr:T9SS type A sorting domain-containing protein [bacterium]